MYQHPAKIQMVYEPIELRKNLKIILDYQAPDFKEILNVPFFTRRTIKSVLIKKCKTHPLYECFRSLYSISYFLNSRTS